MQTSEERKYWAQRRKADRKYPKQLGFTTPRTEVRLLATSQEEYAQLKAQYPDMKIALDMPEPSQLMMFQTEEFIDV